MRRAILLVTATASLTMTAITSQAAIGWNLKECEQAFGKPIIGPKAALSHRTRYEFRTKDFYINTFFLGDEVSRIAFHKKTGYIDKSTIATLLEYGAPNPIWGHIYQDPDGNWHWTDNSKDLFASFADNWTTVVLWTQADRDAIRAALIGINPTLMSPAAKSARPV
jgi:hypothetical protein